MKLKKTLIFALILALAVSLASPALAFDFQVERSAQSLTVDGGFVSCDKYNIDGYNYFKLRDLATLLNGTGSEFDVGWDAAQNLVTITTGRGYAQPNGTELKIGADLSSTVVSSSQTIMIDGTLRSDLTVYNIGGNNFFQLRELGEALGFDVEYDEAANTAMVESRMVSGYPITVTDMTGRTVTLTKPAERIVALSAADCEVLFAVGAGDKLVGRGEYCDYPAEVLSIPSVQSGYETNIEQIIALKPDVLLMSSMAQTEEQVQQLEEAGITVLVSDAQDIEGVYTAIRNVGRLMGCTEKAEEVVRGMKVGLAQLRARAVSAKAAKGLTEDETVYFEVSPLQWGLYSAGSGTFMNEVANLLGLKNIFADQPAWPQVSEEQVIERDPDYIVTIMMYFGEGETPEEEIAGRPGWSYITAVQNGKIIRMEHDELSRPAPRIVEGAQMLFDLVYGG